MTGKTNKAVTECIQRYNARLHHLVCPILVLAFLSANIWLAQYSADADALAKRRHTQDTAAKAKLATPLKLEDAPQIAHIPNNGIVPDAVVGSEGTLHVVYGKGRDAFYTQSRDGGKTFEPSVKMNTRPDTVTVGGERGPKLKLGKSGALHVVWQGDYTKGGGVWVTRSLDGGKTFAPERNILDKAIGIDEPTLAADSSGNVVVLWLDGRQGEKNENPVSSPLYMVRSTDNGATFGANTPLHYDFPGWGCACCTLAAQIQGDQLLIAFRTGYHSIRDMYLLEGPLSENRFHTERISVDEWKFEGCPMSGPRLAIASSTPASSDTSKRILYATWMSRGKVYWAARTTSGLRSASPNSRMPFSTPNVVPGEEGNYPTIVSHRDASDRVAQGHILLVWTRNAETQWAVYEDRQPGSKPITMGTAGTSQGRPTACILPTGRFVIIP